MQIRARPNTAYHLSKTIFNPNSPKFLSAKLIIITASELLRMLYLGVADSGEGPAALYGVVLPRTDRL